VISGSQIEDVVDTLIDAQGYCYIVDDGGGWREAPDTRADLLAAARLVREVWAELALVRVERDLHREYRVRAEALLTVIRAWAVTGIASGQEHLQLLALLDASPVTTIGPHPPDSDAFHKSSGLTPCPECDGRGSVLDAPARALDGRAYVVPCPLCHGTGKGRQATSLEDLT